jgi:hypothetical protein
MRSQPEMDYLAPNLPPKLAVRVKKTRQWARWERTIRSYLS